MDKKEYAKQYYQNNRERLLNYTKEYDKTHPERKKEYRKKYYAEVEKARRQNPEVREQMLERNRKWRKTPKAIESRREKAKENYLKLREKFFEMYGKFCSCCGESQPEFLSLEHKQGQPVGRKNKENTLQATKRAVSEYRPDLFEVLCHNCNQAQKFGAVCPHKRIEIAD